MANWKTVGEIVAALAIVGGGAVWVGSIQSQIGQIGKDIAALKGGPRGRNCESIVDHLGRAIDRGNARAQAEFERLALEYRCAAMEAAFRYDNDTIANVSFVPSHPPSPEPAPRR
jgi:hypothetical protein